MTASTVSSRTQLAGRAPSPRLAGLRPLFRKELGEWLHSKRIWVILIVTTMFMALAAANGAITSYIVAITPEAAPSQPISLVPLDNFMAAISSQIFVLVAIFAAMSLLVAEQEHGTLAWVASKPVSRGAIWTAKWLAAALMVSVVAGLLPLLLT
jgi:ABC-type transport system involved in multi-copper enzyme maturation permease subunit